MKGKACRNCHRIADATTGQSCKACKSSDFSNDYQGLVIILDPDTSIVARKLGVTKEGWYAIKVR
nr:transcription elongation factor subunit Spt4 [Candidatus Njordarchaeota archaeon]